LQELRVLQAQPPVLCCDNIRATYLSPNPVFHARMNHVKVDFHFVREHISHKQLQIEFISFKEQLANIFIKHLPLALYQHYKHNLNLIEPVEIEGG
jgi:hypothetical protein